MLARDRSGFERALPRRHRIATRLVHERREYQCERHRERVRKLARTRDGFVDRPHGRLGTAAEHGSARLEHPRAHARVVPAVARGERGVPFRVIECDAALRVVFRCRHVPGRELGGPLRVMRLKQRAGISRQLRQIREFIRDLA